MINYFEILFKGNTFIEMIDKKLCGKSIIKRDGFSISVELKESELIIIKNYSHVLKSLENGNIIYIANGNAYIGRKATEGQYCEDNIFNSIYDAKGYSMEILIDSLDNNIKNDKKYVKKLVKVGDRYEQ